MRVKRKKKIENGKTINKWMKDQGLWKTVYTLNERRREKRSLFRLEKCEYEGKRK